jgi:hypothetical protein
MIFALLVWVPIKVLKYGLQLVIGTEEAMVDLANLTNQVIDDHLKSL